MSPWASPMTMSAWNAMLMLQPLSRISLLRSSQCQGCGRPNAQLGVNAAANQALLHRQFLVCQPQSEEQQCSDSTISKTISFLFAGQLPSSGAIVLMLLIDVYFANQQHRIHSNMDMMGPDGMRMLVMHVLWYRTIMCRLNACQKLLLTNAYDPL